MYKPASEVVFAAFKEAVAELKNQGLANSNHVIDLARGASVLRSSRTISRQSRHTDFETSACRHRLCPTNLSNTLLLLPKLWAALRRSLLATVGELSTHSGTGQQLAANSKTLDGSRTSWSAPMRCAASVGLKKLRCAALRCKLRALVSNIV